MKYSSNITKSYLIKLSIPIFFSNLAIPLVGIVDTALMGHLKNPSFLAATSIATSVMSLLFWSFGFLRMGTVGLVSQSYGKSDYRELVKIISRNLIIAFGISIFIILLQFPILFLVDLFFQTSYETNILIGKYISIRVYSAPAELIIYVLVGFYLGLQKTKISSFFISLFSTFNILLSLYLVVQLNLEITGVVLGTLISAYITVIIFLIYTYFFITKNFKIIPRFQKLIVRKKLFKLLNINFDIFIRTLFLTFAFLWLNYQGSKLGDDYLAINAILMQFIILASFLLDAFAFSTEGVVGFSIGRKVKNSFLQVAKNAFELSFFTSLIISLLYIIFFKFIVNLITNLDSLRFLAYGYIFWIIIIPPIASFCYQFDGVFIGASQTKEMRNTMVFSVVIFVLISEYLTKIYGNHGLWFAFLTFMILRSISLNFYFNKILKKF